MQASGGDADKVGGRAGHVPQQRDVPAGASGTAGGAAINRRRTADCADDSNVLYL